MCVCMCLHVYMRMFICGCLSAECHADMQTCIPAVYDDVTYVYDDVTYVYDDVTYAVCQADMSCRHVYQLCMMM